MADEASLKPLSKKHRAFVSEYLKRFNGTEAYMAVYPKATRESARALATNLLADVSVKAEIEDSLKALQLDANEVLIRLARMARGVDLTKYTKHVEVIDPETKEPVGLELRFDFEKFGRDGYGDLLKKVATNRAGGVTVDLHDPQAALVQLGRAHGLFTDKVDLTSKGEAIRLVTIDTEKV